MLSQKNEFENWPLITLVQCRYMEYGIVRLCFKGLQVNISIKYVFLSLKICLILVQTVHTVALCALCGFWVC